MKKSKITKVAVCAGVTAVAVVGGIGLNNKINPTKLINDDIKTSQLQYDYDGTWHVQYYNEDGTQLIKEAKWDWGNNGSLEVPNMDEVIVKNQVRYLFVGWKVGDNYCGEWNIENRIFTLNSDDEKNEFFNYFLVDINQPIQLYPVYSSEYHCFQFNVNNQTIGEMSRGYNNPVQFNIQEKVKDGENYIVIGLNSDYTLGVEVKQQKIEWDTVYKFSGLESEELFNYNININQNYDYSYFIKNSIDYLAKGGNYDTSIDIYPSYYITGYRVSFYYDDQELITTQTGNTGTKVNFPEVEQTKTKDGKTYNFVGWYSNNNLIDTANETIQNSNKYYAKYEEVPQEKYYTIRFYDENQNIITGQEVLGGALVQFPEIESSKIVNNKTYNFAGWYDFDNNLIDIDLIANMTAQSDMSFFTKYEEVQETYYVVQFYDENQTKIIDYEVKAGDTIGFPEVEQTKEVNGQTYNFVAWHDYYTNELVTEIGEVQSDRIFYTEYRAELSITSDTYQIEEDEEDSNVQYISNIAPETNIQSFVQELQTNADKVEIQDVNGNPVSEDQLLGTGMKVVATKGEEEVTYDVSVKGDLDGNGQVGITDLIKVRKHLHKIEDKQLTGVYEKAGDINGDSQIGITDLIKIRKHLHKVDYIK